MMINAKFRVGDTVQLIPPEKQKIPQGTYMSFTRSQYKSLGIKFRISSVDKFNGNFNLSPAIMYSLSPPITVKCYEHELELVINSIQDD